MKKINLFVLIVFLLTSCGEKSNKTSKKESNEAICIWNNASLRAGPSSGDKWLSSISLGEIVTLLGESKVDSTDNNLEYLKVKLSDGKEGWVSSYLLIPGGKSAALTEKAVIYKRPDLLISDPERLKSIAEKTGPMQIIYSGKAHPKDGSGKEIIKKIFHTMKSIDGNVKIVYIHNYDITIGKLMTAGVDLWLNTPRRPREASGTSGMKAAHNGVPQFSTLDGWWLEGCVENITGWALGPEKSQDEESDDEIDKFDLYNKLENWIIPKFYKDRDNWIRTMRSCIAINASFFNTNRMIQQYVLNAYFM